MKKFKFKLDKLLDYKDQLLDNELMTLAALNEEMNKVNAAIGKLRAERDRAAAEMREKGDSEEGVKPVDYQIFFRYDASLKEEIRDLKTVAAHLTGQIEKQIELIKKLRLETKSLEVMKESKLAGYKKEIIKAEELMIDEYVNTVRVMSAARH
ncbi:MAG: flagellar export protein FliJ [Clostridiales Family XIII bacterium]|jgi:flagellar FliJ protein|nr:flagellar export protein FliJ [Clostridiales Family XIII bacterium]